MGGGGPTAPCLHDPPCLADPASQVPCLPTLPCWPCITCAFMTQPALLALRHRCATFSRWARHAPRARPCCCAWPSSWRRSCPVWRTCWSRWWRSMGTGHSCLSRTPSTGGWAGGWEWGGRRGGGAGWPSPHPPAHAPSQPLTSPPMPLQLTRACHACLPGLMPPCHACLPGLILQCHACLPGLCCCVVPGCPACKCMHTCLLIPLRLIPP